MKQIASIFCKVSFARQYIIPAPWEWDVIPINGELLWYCVKSLGVLAKFSWSRSNTFNLSLDIHFRPITQEKRSSTVTYWVGNIVQWGITLCLKSSRQKWCKCKILILIRPRQIIRNWAIATFRRLHNTALTQLMRGYKTNGKSYNLVKVWSDAPDGRSGK